ncbi:MAG: cupin domain-containing protein [Chloroflexota bacterium]
MTDTPRERPQGETGGSSQRPARQVAAPLLSFDLAEELRSLKREASWERGDRNARTLVQEPGFRLVLTVLKAEAKMQEHRAAGWASVHCLEGHVRLQSGEHSVDLPAGRLLVLEPEVTHNVEALEASAFLLSIAFRGQSGEGV